jgi:hypothetical protein
VEKWDMAAGARLRACGAAEEYFQEYSDAGFGAWEWRISAVLAYDPAAFKRSSELTVSGKTFGHVHFCRLR